MIPFIRKVPDFRTGEHVVVWWYGKWRPAVCWQVGRFFVEVSFPEVSPDITVVVLASQVRKPGVQNN